MINYCTDYVIDGGSCVETVLSYSNTDREETVKELVKEGCLIIRCYENEDCYCSAYHEGECCCGNFR